MKSLFKKSLTLVLVAVLMFLMVSCVHSAGEGTSAVGESTPAAAGEGSSAAAAGEDLTASEKDPQTGSGGADRGQQLAYHRCRPVEG